MNIRRVVFTLACMALISACADHSQGKAVVQGLCINCHGQGINNAPILGNARMWKARIAQGEDRLVAHAIEGYNMMPPKGGNPDLSDEQIRDAVRYMMSLTQ